MPEPTLQQLVQQYQTQAAQQRRLAERDPQLLPPEPENAPVQAI